MIVSYEKNKFVECYRSNFHMSQTSLLHRQPMLNDTTISPYYQRVIVNWGIFVKPTSSNITIKSIK